MPCKSSPNAIQPFEHIVVIMSSRDDICEAFWNAIYKFTSLVMERFPWNGQICKPSPFQRVENPRDICKSTRKN